LAGVGLVSAFAGVGLVSALTTDFCFYSDFTIDLGFAADF
jgi:hypothetical protein